MTYSNDTHLAEEDTLLFERRDCAWTRKHERAEEDIVRDLERHGYLKDQGRSNHLGLSGFLSRADGELVDSSAPATATLTFTAPAGTIIPAGTKVRVGDPSGCPEHGAVVFATDSAAEVQPGNTSVEATAIASASGRTGNVTAGDLAYLVAEVAGVTSVTNELSATGGADHQLTRLSVYRVMELVHMDLMREKDDPFDHKRRLYAKMYADELERVMAAGIDIDLDGDGEASEGEQELAGHGFHRFGRG